MMSAKAPHVAAQVRWGAALGDGNQQELGRCGDMVTGDRLRHLSPSFLSGLGRIAFAASPIRMAALAQGEQG